MSPRRQGSRAPSVVTEFGALKSEYRMASRSRFDSIKLGATADGVDADVHIRNDRELMLLVEKARYLEINDRTIGAGVGRLVDLVCQQGFALNPQTGNNSLDSEIIARWRRWATRPESCDVRREHDLFSMIAIAFRRIIVDGDIFALLLGDGRIQWHEAHRCRSCEENLKPGRGRTVVHGVELDGQRASVAYWFTRRPVSLRRSIAAKDALKRVEAYDENGQRVVLHGVLAERMTQARGVTSLARMQNDPGQFDDILFAHLVNAQAQACVTFSIEKVLGMADSPSGLPGMGPETTDVNGRRVVEFAPGATLELKPGESLKAHIPQIAAGQFREFADLILTIIAINLRIPLQVLLLDPTKTNFSGWRAAMNIAQVSLRELQRQLIQRFYTPIYRWWLAREVQRDKVFAARVQSIGDALFAHEFHAPGWDSIQPVDDATADSILLGRAMMSPIEYQAKRGRDWDAHYTTTIDAYRRAIDYACAAVTELRTRHPDVGAEIGWRDLLPLPTADGLKISLTTSSAAPAQEGAPAHA